MRCGNCGKPANYVDEYSRWYCYPCQQYLPEDAVRAVEREHAMIDLPSLVLKARDSNDQHLIDTIHTRVLSAYQWFYITKDPAHTTPSDGPAQAPVMTGLEDGKRSMFLFTSTDRLNDFMKKEGMVGEGGDQWVIATTPISIINSSEQHAKDGIDVILVNDNWEMPMASLRSTYYHYVKPHDFKTLIETATRTDATEDYGNLWKAVFDLPMWFFIGRPEDGVLLMTGGPGRFEVHLYLSYALAEKELISVNRSKPGMNFRVFPLTPDESLGFLRHLGESVKPAGLLLRDEGATTGITFTKIFDIKRLMDQNAF